MLDGRVVPAISAVLELTIPTSDLVSIYWLTWPCLSRRCEEAICDRFELTPLAGAAETCALLSYD